MRRGLIVAALAAVACAVLPGAAAATNECRGLQVCVPVAGPWVVVPTAQTLPRPHVEFQLACPKGYIVAGLDAELSDRRIDLAFLGTMGAPVNPGVSTSANVVFVGTYVGQGARAASFRPHIGCMPASGGGSRTPTALVFPPGKPLVRRVRNAVLRPGTRTITRACSSGERLVGATHAIAFSTQPDARLVSLVRAKLSYAGDRAVVRATRRYGNPATAFVQVAALCAGGK